MPSDIQMPKAPANWRPNADQMQQIQNDPRLRSMSVNDQYFYFNKPPIPSTVRVQRGSAQPQPSQPVNHLNGGVAGVFDYIRRAMGGK